MFFAGGLGGLMGGGVGGAGALNGQVTGLGNSFGGRGGRGGGMSFSGVGLSQVPMGTQAAGINGIATPDRRPKFDPMLLIDQFQWLVGGMSAIQKIFGTEYDCIWRRDAGILEVYPTPVASQAVLIRYQKRENEIYCYNNEDFQQLLLNRLIMVWKSNVGTFDNERKFNNTLFPGTVEHEEKLILMLRKQNNMFRFGLIY
jgi:hypothetical protein